MSGVGAPRIGPGTPGDIGWLNALIVGAIARTAGTSAPHLFKTLARHRRLFRAWLLFAGALMPRGSLPRADTELVILRVAHNCGCDYEWGHHERLALVAGLDTRDVERVRFGPNAPGWSTRQSLLLRAADELYRRRTARCRKWS
jgi:AhpD family alkylhydroperoxidase